MKQLILSGERFYGLGESNAVKELFRKACDVFERFGYDYINLSYFEPHEFQELAFGEKAREAITFKDTFTKETFGLRLDFTTQVMRTVVSMHGVRFPERFYYFGSVFSLDRKGYEKLQTGVELLGERSLKADLEVIEVILTYLREVGIKRPKVVLSHARITERLKESVGEEALKERNLSLMERVFGEEVRFLLGVEGNYEILEFLKNLGLEEEREELKAVAGFLESLGIGFAFDLCEVRNFPYYTGVIFEVYDQERKTPLGGGGRYDRLSEIYGREIPSTGGALYLERLLSLFPERRREKDYYLIDLTGRNLGREVAELLRKRGKRVVCERAERLKESTLIGAFERGFREVIVLEEKNLRVYTTPKEFVVMTLKEFVELAS
ncbi:MAG: hypothetical protein GXN96_02295 [Aquificae bacterium]|nr:hypothetical protein [Aquificota bacterium]